MMQLNRNREEKVETNVKLTSKLAQWPVQIKLVPINAPYFDGANLLIAADCTAYAYAKFPSGIYEWKDYNCRLSKA